MPNDDLREPQKDTKSSTVISQRACGYCGEVQPVRKYPHRHDAWLTCGKPNGCGARSTFSAGQVKAMMENPSDGTKTSKPKTEKPAKKPKPKKTGKPKPAAGTGSGDSANDGGGPKPAAKKSDWGFFA